MTNNIINNTHSRFSDRIVSISNSEQGFSKKNSQGHNNNHQKLASVSPILMSYVVGKKYIGIVEKKISNKKYLLSVNNEAFYFSSGLNFEINTKISLEIDSIIKNYILATILEIDKKILNISEKVKLELAENLGSLNKNVAYQLFLDEKSIIFINLLSLINLHENTIFRKYIIKKLPSYSKNDSKKILDLISNISNSTFQKWLSTPVLELLKKNNKIDILNEIDKVNKIDKNNGWLSVLIPYYYNERKRVFDFSIRLTNEKTKRIRFKVKFELEKAGKTIIEGIISLNKINMIILYTDKLDEIVEKTIKNIFYNSLIKHNYLGNIKFNKINTTPSQVNIYNNSFQESNYKIDT